MRLLPSINRDPKLLPVNARVYIAGSMMIIAFIIILSEADPFDKLSACGLVLGIFGSGVLYWETIASDVSLSSVSNEIARMAQNQDLSISDAGTIVIFGNLGFFLLFLLPATLVFIRFRQSNDPVYMIKSISMIAFASASPAIGVYTTHKIIRNWSFNWINRFRLTPEGKRTAYIKRFLRLTGFAALFVSGVMQLPAALF